MAADNKTFYIEKDTNYALQVEYAANINFDDIKRIAKFFVMQLPEAVQNKIYNELDRGVNIIDSEPQLNMYLHSFGNMHQAKMKHAFSNIDKDWFDNQEIEIVDYGCGQALATMLYHDYLQANGISQTVSKITLIEPSEKALCRAGLHAKAFYPEAEIHTINKLLNDVAPTEISHSGKPVLHLFSNILDIEVVDLHHLATLAQAENEETDTLWVCVSPFFGNHKDNRIPCFLDILNQPKTYTFQRRKGTWQNQWTINCIIAEQKQEENLSTKVTDEEIANGTEDEYGCIYSRDGKRLLKGNKDITSYTVKEGTKVICDKAFLHCSSLQSIVIPDSVTKIASCAFGACSSLQSIVIPDSVTEIGDWALGGCSSLQSIVIPESVTEIGVKPFGLGKELTSHSNRFVVEDDLLIDLKEKRLIQCLKDKDTIVIPNSVTEIGHCAFSRCSSLQNIDIPDSVTEIGYSAFYECLSLQSIFIPDSVTKIGVKPFGLGKELTSHSNRFVVEDDLLIDLEEKRLIQCLKNKKHVDIPDSVTEIGGWAFSGCESLQSIVIPDSVTKIGNQAFYDCKSLQSIIIPDSVTEIGDSAFDWCKSLQSIVIPDSVTEIGHGTFSCCGSLQSIVIPESVIKIRYMAFMFCSSLQSIVIPDSVTEIGDYAFAWCESLQSIVIPDSVTKIGDCAFSSCKSLQSIVIPKGKKKYFENILEKEYHHLLKEMDEENFSTKVTDEEIANGIKDEYGCIYSPDGKRLLKGNKEITSYTIKEGTEVICDKAFETSYFLGNYSLKSIVIPESVTKIGDWAFNGCFSLQSIVIPESVTKIGRGAFFDCSSLKSIVIPDSVTEIGKETFSRCTSLQNTVIPDSVTEIGKETFSRCTSLQSIFIPESVTEIGGLAFRGCSSLKSIVIPDSVTEIGSGAFRRCESLQRIVIPDSVTEIGSSPFPLGIYLTFHSDRFVVENDLLIDLEEKRLIQCLKNKKHVDIPNSVTSIGNSAFSSCDSLQSIVIPDSVTKIGGWAFTWCDSLQSIVIPNSVTEIGYSAFGYCKSLRSIVIPDSVTEIGDYAFCECESLQSIVIPKGKKEYFEVLLRGRYYDLLKEMDYKEVYNDSEPIINSVWNMKGIWKKLKSIMLRLRR